MSHVHTVVRRLADLAMDLWCLFSCHMKFLHAPDHVAKDIRLTPLGNDLCDVISQQMTVSKLT